MARYLEARKQIDAATARVNQDRETPVADIAAIALDASTEGRTDAAVEILASIPPIKLGRTTYRVTYVGKAITSLVGPRGGDSCLVQNVNRPDLWAHVINGKTVWYKRDSFGMYVRES